jgi:hypothetical protein
MDRSKAATTKATVFLHIIVIAMIVAGAVLVRLGEPAGLAFTGGGHESPAPVSLWLPGQNGLLLSLASPPQDSLKAYNRVTATTAVSIEPVNSRTEHGKIELGCLFIAIVNGILRTGGYRACFYLDIPPPTTPTFL